MKRDFVSLKDLSPIQVERLFEEADRLKKSRGTPLKGKTLALVFQKPSMRTRVSFEVGMLQLGGAAIYLGPEGIQLGIRETVPDIAQGLSRYVDGIVARTFSHEDIETLGRYASIPVINGLSDREHPCQALADLYTIRQIFGRLKKVKIAYVGDGNNVLHSLLHGVALVGADLSAATPKRYAPNGEVVKETNRMRRKTGARISLGHDPKQAVRGADIVYTDVWTSMGQEGEKNARRKAFRGYQVNEALMKQAKSSAFFMHCLPAHRGEEVTEGVLEGRQSAIWDQAENRLHVQKAILATLLSSRA